MGQTLGRAPRPLKCGKLLNLPKSCVYGLYTAYNDLAEGFGLSIEEMAEICKTATLEHLGITERVLIPDVDALFRLLDDDENRLVDALEFISALALLSSLTPEEKIRLVFALYDFDETGLLTLDEMVLAFRSCLSGACKLCRVDPPNESDLEATVALGFDLLKTTPGPVTTNDGLPTFTGIDRESFVAFCLGTPDVTAWLDWFDDVFEFAGGLDRPRPPALTAMEMDHQRDAVDEAVMNPTLGTVTRSQLEDNCRILPKRSWRNVLPFLAPAVPPPEECKRPGKNLVLEWVYGYSGYTMRHNVFYTSTGEILYPAGAIVVIQSVTKHEQRHFAAHYDIVTAITVSTSPTNPSETIVATGESGYRPTIFVWEASTCNLLAALNGFHRGGISGVHFSPSRELLVSVGMDPYHSVAVYRWASGERLWAGRSTIQTVHCVRWLAEDLFATAGEGHVFFWSYDSSLQTPRYRRYRGQGKGHNNELDPDAVLFLPPSTDHGSASIGNGVPSSISGYGETTESPQNETFLCVDSIDGSVFTSTSTGYLQIWQGRNWVRSIKAHLGAITAVTKIEETGLVTGCSQGKVQVWNAGLEVIATFSVAQLGALNPAVQAVAYDGLTNRLLLGVASGEIFEMDATDGRNVHTAGSVVCGNFHGRVSCVAAHPFNASIVATVGQDRTVRIYDAKARRLIRMAQLDTKAYSVRFSNDGMALLIGLGTGASEPSEGSTNKVTGLPEDKEGVFLVIATEDLTLIHEARDSKHCISAGRYSPAGDTFTLASHDHCLYVYTVKKHSCIAICRGHTAPVCAVDYSTTGQYLMSNSVAGELFFWEAATGQQVTPKAVKGVKWETNSCVYSWNTQSLHGSRKDEEKEVFSIIRLAAKTHAENALVSITSHGSVCLTAFPCLASGEIEIASYAGHGKGVCGLDLSCNDQFVFSTGERDGCLLQWQLVDIDGAGFMPGSDLKRSDNGSVILPSLASELAWQGRILDRPPLYEAAVCQEVGSICALEEAGLAVAAGLAGSGGRAMLPWQKNIIAPSRGIVEDTSEPPDRLELEFVYGLTTDITRRGLLYVRRPDALEGTHAQPGNELLYTAGSIAVMMSTNTREQRFFQGHVSKITSIAMNDVHGVVATGEQCKLPRILIWGVDSLETIATLACPRQRTVQHLRFSRDGVQLLALGQDLFHTLTIYDWQRETVLATTTTSSNICFDADFSPSGTTIAQSSHELIRFWTRQGRSLHFQDAILTARAKPQQSFLCIGWIGNHAVVGTADGNFYRFLGHRLESIVQAHTTAVAAITCASDGLVSAGLDGYIKLWTRYLECRLVIDSKAMNSLSPQIRSVDWLDEAGAVAFSTAAGEIFEVSAADGENRHKGTLMEGHGGDELWGLAVHPESDTFATVGDDALLRIWNLSTHRAIHTVGLEMPARCCAFSPDGKHLAVGFGSAKKLTDRQFDGKWIVIDTEDYQVSHEARDSMKWLREAKYSPNGRLIAFSSEDSKLYIYNVTEGYSLTAVITTHQAFIFTFDFSEDSQWIRTNCGGFELNFFEAETGLHIPAAARLRDVAWASQQCVLEYNVQGIWPAHADGTDIIAMDTNNIRGEDGPVIVAGDNYGRLRMWRYPCLSSSSAFKQYWPSSSRVTRLRFAAGDAALISLGGADKIVYQWRHIRDRDENVAYQTNERRGQLNLKTAAADAKASALVLANVGVASGGGSEEEEEDIAGWFAQFQLISTVDVVQEELSKLITMRPWLGAILPPSNIHDWERLFISPLFTRPLPFNLELYHISGLSTELTRGSVAFFNASQKMLFPSSHYIICFDRHTNQQSFYKHEQEVATLTVSSDGLLAASAERTLRPQIHVWDAQALTTLVVLPVVHRRGVLSLEFSPDNHWLLSLGADSDASLALWHSANGSWRDARLISWHRADVAPVLFASFYPCATRDSALIIATGGRSHVKFWTCDGHGLHPLYAEYGQQIRLGTILSGARVGKRFLTGSASGHVHVWVGRRLERIIRAHERGITCVRAVHVNSSNAVAAENSNRGPSEFVLTASKDGTVKLWTGQMEHLHTVNLADADVPPLNSAIRSVDCLVSTEGQIRTLLIATASSELYEVCVLTRRIYLVHEGHYTGELWGLAPHPRNPDLYLTSGDDCTVRLWSISQKRLLRKAVIDCTVRAVTWSPDGRVIIVGLGGAVGGGRQRKDGAFLLLDGETLKPKFEGRDSRHWITYVAFSPSGNVFAVASMDHRLYLYQTEPLRLRGQGDISNGSLMSLDFTADGGYIQASSLASYEHLYYEAEDGQGCTQAQSKSLRDVEWSTWTCPFGWPMQGIWPTMEEEAAEAENNSNYVQGAGRGKAPCTVHRAPNDQLLAVGDSSGKIRLYRFPAVVKKSPSVVMDAHIGEVAKVRFTCDGKHLLSIGKKDRAIALWRVFDYSGGSRAIPGQLTIEQS